MKTSPGGFVFLALLCMMGAIGVNWFANMISPHPVDPSRGSINMIQPNGWMPNRDAHYAQEVNEPNSRANENNGQANYYNAQATQITSQTIVQRMEDSRGDMALGGIGGCIVGMILFGTFGGLVLAIVSKSTGG